MGTAQLAGKRKERLFKNKKNRKGSFLWNVHYIGLFQCKWVLFSNICRRCLFPFFAKYDCFYLDSLSIGIVIVYISKLLQNKLKNEITNVEWGVGAFVRGEGTGDILSIYLHSGYSEICRHISRIVGRIWNFYMYFTFDTVLIYENIYKSLQ